MEFGDSAINLELRFWISDSANVHSAALLKQWDLLQQHGIDIPSPQHELTLRNPEPLAHALVREQSCD